MHAPADAVDDGAVAVTVPDSVPLGGSFRVALPPASPGTPTRLFRVRVPRDHARGSPLRVPLVNKAAAAEAGM